MAFELRYYQQDAAEATMEDWAAGIMDTLVTFPTGTGKTATFTGLMSMLWQPGQRVIVMAHTEELVDQPRAAFEKIFSPQHKKAKLGTVRAQYRDYDADIIFATVQTLSGSNYKALFEILKHGKVDYIITDETHHIVADTYMGVLRRVRTVNEWMLGINVIKEARRQLKEEYPKQLAMLEAQAKAFSEEAYDNALANIVKWKESLENKISRGEWAEVADYSEIYLNEGLYSLGVTATAARTDEKNLDEMFPALCELDRFTYVYTVAQAIKDCILAPFRVANAITEWDGTKEQGQKVWDANNGYEMVIDQLIMSMNRDTYPEGTRYKFAEHHEGVVRGVKLGELKVEPAMMFMPGIDESKRFTFVAGDIYGIKGVHVDGTKCLAWDGGALVSVKRKDATQGFLSQEYIWGSNFGVWCLDSETEILTSSGFVGMEDMTYQHKVANWDDGEIFFKEPRHVLRRKRHQDEKMVSLETPRRSIRVTQNHRMLFKKQHQEKFGIIHAIGLHGAKGHLPISGMSEPEDIKPVQGHRAPDRAKAIRSNSYALRKREGFGYEESKVEAARRYDQRYNLKYKNPSDLSLDECNLIGFWLGDGTRTELQSGGVEYTITQSVRYRSIIDWFDTTLGNLGFDFIRRDKVRKEDGLDRVMWAFPRGTGFGAQKRSGLYPIEPYLNKSGTELFWGLTEEQFDALIEGFVNSDGDHGTKYIRIYNTNLELLDLLQSIAVCRGYRASIRNGHNHLKNEKHSKIYKLSMAKSSAHMMTTKTLQIEDGWKDEDVWCVTSHTGNIITRRNGSVTVMGNTEGFDAPHVAHGIIARDTASVWLYIQMLGRYLRLDPANPDKVAFILQPDYMGHIIQDVTDFIGHSRSSEAEETEKALDLLMIGSVAPPPPCPECQGELRRVRGTRTYQCQSCEKIWNGDEIGDDLQGLVDENSISGKGSYTKYLNMFAQAAIAWYREAGIWSVALGVGGDCQYSRTLVIIPPGLIPSRPDGFSLLEIRNKVTGRKKVGIGFRSYIKYETSYHKEGVFIGAPGPMDEIISIAQERADKYGEPALSDKSRKWRKDPASEKQIAQLIRLKIASHLVVTDAGVPKVTKGDAGRLHSHHDSLIYIRSRGIID